MKVTITTGVQFAERRPPKSFTVDAPDIEFEPDLIFRAANRIDEQDEDCRSLAEPWLRSIRRKLDDNEAPSMSVQDTIKLHSDSGLFLGGWRCESCGWTALR